MARINITVFTGASFRVLEGPILNKGLNGLPVQGPKMFAAHAIWIEDPQGETIHWAGPFKTLPRTAFEAELIAACRGVYYACRKYPDATHIYLSFGCLAAIEYLMPGGVKMPRTNLAKKALKATREILISHKTLLIPRTSYTPRGKDKPCTHGTRWCDKEAKRVTRSMVKEYRELIKIPLRDGRTSIPVIAPGASATGHPSQWDQEALPSASIDLARVRAVKRI